MVWKDNYFVLTGAMGAGKSALLAQLRTQECLCIDDPARQILAEQRAIGGEGLPEVNPSLFNQLMLSRAIYLHHAHLQERRKVLFDRGVPDLIAYAELFGIDRAVYERAALKYVYGGTAFYFPGWEEIYTKDDERRMEFPLAMQFGENVARIYEHLGYQIIEVPKASIEERLRFIVESMEGKGGD